MALPQQQPQNISAVMRQLMDQASLEESFTIAQILEAFGVHGFAFLILMLSLLNIVIFMVPFSSILFGLPMVILAVQMLLGMRTPMFPHVILRQTIKREALMQGLSRAIYGVEKIERFIKPRLMFLTSPHLDRVHGILSLLLAILVTIPIPVFNVAPAFGLVFLAIGMLQKDGVFILLAYAAGLGCFLVFKSILASLRLR